MEGLDALFEDDKAFYVHLLHCKCVCGLTVVEQKFTAHLGNCKYYIKNSRFYQAYRQEIKNAGKSNDALQKICQSTTNLLKIVEDKLGIIPACTNEEILKLIDTKIFPQSYFEFDADDFHKLKWAESVFLRGEVLFILENLELEMASDLQLKKIQSTFSHALEVFPDLKMGKSRSNIDSSNLEKKIFFKSVLVSKCDSCKKSNLDFQEIFKLSHCSHSLCSICLANMKREYVYHLGVASCVICNSQLSTFDLINIMGARELKKLNALVKRKLECPLIKCLGCKKNFHDDLQDKTIVQPDIENWVKCPHCNEGQCKSCRCMPYHKGTACEVYLKERQVIACRYCKEKYPADLTKYTDSDPHFRDVCLSKECQDKIILTCQKKLACNHACCGSRDESECLECLHANCNKGNEKAFLGTEYCFACYTDELFAGPCVKSSCGHIFHFECIVKMLDLKWNTKWISFNFCKCPLCKQVLDFPFASPALKDKIKQIMDLQEDVKKRAVEKLKADNKDQDPELIEAISYFFNKPEEYALKLFAYYECFKCKKPYFGGMHNCEHEIQEIEQNAEEEKQDFDRTKLICQKCIDFRKCDIHGTDDIEWKCRFCCSTARWYCFGTTHFCEPCHNIWQQQQEKEKDGKLDQCTPETCKLGIEHPPNGTEFGLGCAACRYGIVKEVKP